MSKNLIKQPSERSFILEGTLKSRSQKVTVEKIKLSQNDFQKINLWEPDHDPEEKIKVEDQLPGMQGFIFNGIFHTTNTIFKIKMIRWDLIGEPPQPILLW